MKIIQTVFGLVKLLRFELPFAAGICVVMGQLFALGHFAPVSVTIAGALSIFCISAAILVLNDVIDLETDRINAPERPIPSGMVAPYEALLFSMVLLGTGLIVSYTVGTMALICAFAVLIVGVLYNVRFKRYGLAGNLMVSVSVGMTFIYGGITVGSYNHPLVWLFGAIAALIDLGEEIAADAMDAEGDRIIGSRSLAIKHGNRTALVISKVLFLIVILLTSLPFMCHWLTYPYGIPILMMDVIIGVSAMRLGRSDTTHNRILIRRIYLGSTASLLIIIVMRLFGV